MEEKEKLLPSELLTENMQKLSWKELLNRPSEDSPEGVGSRESPLLYTMTPESSSKAFCKESSETQLHTLSMPEGKQLPLWTLFTHSKDKVGLFTDLEAENNMIFPSF